MSVLWRILSVASLAVSAGILVLSVRSVRKEQKVRPGLDVLRFGILLGTTWLMGALLGVATSEWLRGLGLLVGLGFGLYEGLHLRVRFLGGRVFARRSVLGILAWGLGVVVVQAAGAIDRIGLADLGLALSLVGIGQVVGLFAGRWQVVLSARRPAGRFAGAALLLAIVLAGAVWPAPGPRAGAADPVDVRTVLAGGVPGLSLEVRGNGRFFGPALDLVFTNGTGSEVTVMVPLGLQFLPENEAVQTMIAAGAEAIIVPLPQRAGEYTTQIQAFCGQYHDDIPTAEDRFSAGEVASGPVAAVVALINEGGVFDRDQQEAVWQVTDGYDISANPAAQALVQEAEREGGTAAPVAATDADPENRLWDCATNPAHRVGFGDPTEDRVRCFTFRYAPPARGIESAVVYLSIEVPTGSLQETDQVAVAVGEAFPDQCGLAGEMAGCVLLHEGFAGGERSLTIDLFDLACDARFGGTAEMQEAVRAQVQSGVLHLILQDDTNLYAARLALNEGPPALPCGTSTSAAPVDTVVPGGEADLTAGEGARTAVTGLAGAAALLATTLAGSGSSLGSLAAAWRGGGFRGVYRAVGSPPAAGDAVPADLDAAGSVGGPRAQAVLDGLPPGLRARVEEVMAARLEDERVEFLMASVPGGGGAPGAGADPGEALRASPRAQALLEKLPGDVRRRLEEKAVVGLQERRLTALADKAAQALRRDRALGLVREAIGRGDGPGVQQVLAALGEDDRAGVWARAVSGLEQQARDLQFPPSAAGAGPVRPPDLDGFGDADVDLRGALPAGGEAEALLTGLSGETRPGVEGRLIGKLEAARLARWVEKLRGAAQAAGGGSGGSVLQLGEVSHLAEALPVDIRDGVVLAAGGVVDGETVAGLAETAHRLVEEAQAGDLLRTAASLGDGDRVDAILDAMDAALGAADEGGLESLLRRLGLDRQADLARLRRKGGPRPAVDLTEHLAGAPDLLAAVLPVAGVEDTLRQAGSLRPQVEGALQRRLEAGRVERAVRRGLEAAAAAEPGLASAALPDVPGVREAVAALPRESRGAARQLLQERFEARRVNAAVAAVEAASRVDRAQAALQRAAAAGDLAAADRALRGLTPEQIEEVAAAAGLG